MADRGLIVAVQESYADIGKIDEASLIAKIEALEPSKQQQKSRLFEKLYPAIESALGRNVPQKTIVAELKVAGLTLSMGGFRALLTAMRTQRGASQHESGSPEANLAN
jgi:hypothetical protein